MTDHQCIIHPRKNTLTVNHFDTWTATETEKNTRMAFIKNTYCTFIIVKISNKKFTSKKWFYSTTWIAVLQALNFTLSNKVDFKQ